MNWSRPFILRPIGTSLIMVGVLVLGLVSYTILPVASIPQVDFPTIEVSASLPGASAETMASAVAAPLERQLAQISGVTDLSSSSALGQTTITVEFDLGRDINAAAQDVQSALNTAAGTLPKDLPSPPVYEKVNPAEATVLSLAVTSSTLPIAIVDDYADNYVAQRLSRVTGVGLVDLNGEQKRAVRVRINPDAIAAMGLSLEDVRAAIGQSTIDRPKGTLDGPARTVTINSTDQLLNAAAYNSLIIAYRNGTPIRIADIGSATDSVEDVNRAGWSQTERTVIVDIHKQPGSNVVETVNAIKAKLPEILNALPPSVHVRVIGDRTQTIRASILDVQRTLLLAIVLVVCVVFVFLRRLWATLIPGIAIPLSIIGTFALMYLLRYSIDNISLMALTIAVGFVVDDAIVMVENIVRRIEDGEAPLDASIRGAQQIGFTVVSMTLSLIAVFLPVLLMGGIIGRLFREFAVTVSIAVVISAIVSLTLTPTMCAYLLRQEKPERGFSLLDRIFERPFQRLLALYERCLRQVLKRRSATLAVTLATLVATLWLYADMPKGFFPQQDTGVIVGTTDAAQDISYPEMAKQHQALMRLVIADPDVANAFGWIGPDPSENVGRVIIILKPFAERRVTADQVIARLKPQIRKLTGISLSMQSRQDLRVGAHFGRTQYQYTLQDPDLAELYKWVPVILKKLKTLEAIEDVDTDFQSAASQQIVTIDRETASRLGVTPQAIDDTLYDAFGQRQVATLYTQQNQYHVVMEVDPRYKQDVSALRNLYVPSATSHAQVPLASIARLEQAVVPLTVEHEEQLPAVTLSFALPEGVSLGEAIAAIHGAERELAIPATLQAQFQGSAKAFSASLRSQPYLILATILAVYIVLGILYESLIHPLTIISTLPSAGLGALIALRLTGHDLDVMGLIGIVLLIGIVKKNAILMIDFAIAAERASGLSPEEAIFRAALLRFRPIMMTTMAALFGAIPLSLGSGAGSELRAPLGIAIVGGLMISQVLTLFTTPVIYLGLEALRRRFRRV